MTRVQRVVAEADFGRPTARKGGRNPKFPYVPVIDHGEYTKQILGRAFTTREEAVNCATDVIEYRRADLAERLAQPRYRALREQHGLPREIELP